VPLAAIPDAANVPDAIATALSVTINPGQDPIQSIVHFLKDLRLLLLLDNFEHIVDAATVVSALLERAPGLKVLVTSREPLRLVQEQEFPVPPLALPTSANGDSVAALASCEALQLFVERARAVDSEFRITSKNAPTIAEICLRLDGLPLAIELAAARMKLFSAQQLLERLKERFKVLVGGRRNLPERQQTLRNTVDWSYQFLSAEEKKLFHRLAVFAGGFTLESGEAVCASSSLGSPLLDVASGIESLLNKSLLGRRVSDSENAPRLRMLETIREYAVERLDQDPQAKLLHNAHASYFAGFSADFNAWMHKDDLTRKDAVGWIHRVAADHDNIRSAVEWSISTGEIRDAFRIVWALRTFSFDQGYLREASGWVERLAGRGEGVDPRYRARLHKMGGMIASLTGDEPKAEREYKQAIRLAREAGDVLLEADAEYSLAFRDVDEPKRHKEIEERIHHAEDLFRKTDSRAWIVGTSNALGALYYFQGRYEEALAKFQEALAASRRGDNHGLLVNIGATFWHLGRSGEAKVLLRQVLTQEREGTCSWQTVSLGLLGLAAASEDQQRAARLLAASDALLRAKQMVRTAGVKMVYGAIRARIALSIDEETYDRLCTEARNSGIAAAIAYALEESEGPTGMG
jgi:predicted ATPase